MSEEQVIPDPQKIRHKIFTLIQDGAARRITIEMFIDIFVPLFGHYGSQVFNERENEILEKIFQETPYFLPVIFFRKEEKVFLDIRRFRELLLMSHNRLRQLEKQKSPLLQAKNP